jgi:peptidoglycan glycosyltransferase
LIAERLGAETMKQYTEKTGLTGSYSVDGLPTAMGTFSWENMTAGDLGWAGVGQHKDQVNPCSLMVYMGAIANGGKAAVPQIIQSTVSATGIPSLPGITKKTGTLVSGNTAEKIAQMMAENVEKTYGTKRFPNMQICAKSGTAEVGADQKPHAWFTGFLQNEDAPYAFVVLVENGGSGSSVAGTVAGKVLDVIVNGYQ